jgi:RimJ/RimL family protein N-acetyltransferase
MTDDIFRGKLVRLTTENSQTLAEAFSRWNRDSEYHRLLDTEPSKVASVKSIKDWVEKVLEKENADHIFFTIHTLDDDHLIGFIGLDSLEWTHGDAFVFIALGEREYWGRGYGTDAMRVILRYAFTEINLHRVSLDVFSYNPRAIRSYEKAGFKHEGCLRKLIYRDGERADDMWMGILRDEWVQQQEA